MAEQRKMIEARQLVDAAMQSGQVRVWRADVVYKADAFVYHSGTDPKIEHQPTVFGDRGAFLGAYSIVELGNGERSFEFMRADDVEKAKRASKATGTSSPWVVWFDEMAKKAVIKRHAKRFSHIPALQSLIDQDNEEYEKAPPGYTPAKQPPKSAPPPKLTPRTAIRDLLLERLEGDDAMASKCIGTIESIDGEIDDGVLAKWSGWWQSNPPPKCPICFGNGDYVTNKQRKLNAHDETYGDNKQNAERRSTPCDVCGQTGMMVEPSSDGDIALPKSSAVELIEAYDMAQTAKDLTTLAAESATVWSTLSRAEKIDVNKAAAKAKSRIQRADMDARAEDTLAAMGTAR